MTIFAAMPVAVAVLSATLAAQKPVPAPPQAAVPSEQPGRPLTDSPPAMHAPPVQHPAEGQIFRSGASLVGLNVTVLNGGRLVTGLTREQFEVYEDGVQQQVRFFDAEAVPMDIILLLDTSASMRGRMATVHDAARDFMAVLGPGDRGAVVAFNDNVHVLQDLTSEHEAIEAAINGTVPQGSTALNNAIYIALKTFGRAARSTGDVRRQAIAVLSDGEDTASLVSADDVLALARRTGVNIYTIGLRPESAARPDTTRRRYLSAADYALQSLAKETGARSFFPSTIAELRTAYQAIAAELDSQYSIGYTPANGRADGRFRRIAVRVPSDPTLQSRTRAGYTADGVRSRADQGDGSAPKPPSSTSTREGAAGSPGRMSGCTSSCPGR